MLDGEPLLVGQLSYPIVGAEVLLAGTAIGGAATPQERSAM